MRSKPGLNYEVGRTYPWPEITRQDPFSPVSFKKAESTSSRAKKTKDNQHEHKGRNRYHKHIKYSSSPNSSSSKPFQYSQSCSCRQYKDYYFQKRHHRRSQRSNSNEPYHMRR